MRFLEFLRKEEPPKKEESETERKLLGRTAIEQFEESLLPELRQEVNFMDWELFASKRKEARKLREEFQIIDQPGGMYEPFPIEAHLFELYLTERLLRTEKLITSRRLRIDIQLKGSLVSFGGRSRLRKPEEIHKRQKEIGGAIIFAKRSEGLILGEYASEIETDPEKKEFRAWVLFFERLAQQFAVLFFDEQQSQTKIKEVIKLKRPDMLDRRKAMLQQANLQLTS